MPFHGALTLKALGFLFPVQHSCYSCWGLLCPPLFLHYLWSNYNQTWHDGTLGQNPSKAIKILLTSSPGGKHDVIKQFFGSVPSQNSRSCIFCPMELKFGTEVNSEAVISNSSQKIRYKHVFREKKDIYYRNPKFLPKSSLTKVLPWQHPRLLVTEGYFK